MLVMLGLLPQDLVALGRFDFEVRTVKNFKRIRITCLVYLLELYSSRVYRRFSHAK